MVRKTLLLWLGRIKGGWSSDMSHASFTDSPASTKLSAPSAVGRKSQLPLVSAA